MLSAIGKKQTSMTTITFGSIPYPNQIINNGASTTIGIVCEITSNGFIKIRNKGITSIRIAMLVPIKIAKKSPL